MITISRCTVKVFFSCCRASDLLLPRHEDGGSLHLLLRLLAEEHWQEPGHNPLLRPFCLGTRSTGCQVWREGWGRQSPGGI